MFKLMRKRHLDDSGFTLIELMVVVLIIAVLVAIAIPSFLGFRNRANDRSSQAELRNVLLAEKAYWTDFGLYSAVQGDLTQYEPTIVLVADHTAGDGVEAILNVADSGIVCLLTTSASGTVFGVWESDTTGTFYGEGDQALCDAAAPAGWTQGGW